MTDGTAERATVSISDHEARGGTVSECGLTLAGGESGSYRLG